MKQHTWVVRWLICCLLWGIRLMQVTRHLLRHHVIPYLAWPLGWLRSHRQVVAVWPEGAVPLGPRVALFCHFDAQGAVRADVLRYLAALREAGFSIIAVSNGGALQPLAMTHLQTVCAAVLVRRNVGYDFCAWREALERFDVPRSDTELVLLANDSVYGPLHSLTPILARVMAGGADVWGLTDSNQIRFHLQSYFLVAGAAIWLIAAGPNPEAKTADRGTVWLAVIGGVGFGVYFVALKFAGSAGVIWPLATARMGSLAVCSLLVGGMAWKAKAGEEKLRLTRAVVIWAMGAVLLDT